MQSLTYRGRADFLASERLPLDFRLVPGATSGRKSKSGTRPPGNDGRFDRKMIGKNTVS